MNYYYRQIIKPLVFVLIFGTVAPVSVFAQETTYIVNTVQSSSHTGGQSGSNGANGSDGLSGEDGKSGQDGTSVIRGDGSATVRVNSTLNGEIIEDFVKTVTGTGDMQAEVSHEVDTSATTSLGAGDVPGDPDTSSHSNSASGSASGTAAIRTESSSQLYQILTAIRTLLITYVGKLF